jgi:predicted nuclease with TOPRIM domain
MPAIKPKKQADMTLEDVRALIKEVRDEGLQIQSHYKRLNKDYSDWEDRVNELENIIYQAELDTGLKKEEIYKEPNEFADDILNGDLSTLDISDEDFGNILDNPQ